MPKKTIIIFITVFILTGVIILGVYFWFTKDKTVSPTETTPWYQNFNPFGTGTNVENPPNTEGPGIETPNNDPGTTNTQPSRFSQITDFAVAGATFLEDTRPVVDTNEGTESKPEQIITIINANTKEGRKEIQKFLNETLSLKPPLTTDGNFGKLTNKAIGEFQKLKNLAVTGKVDAETAPYFTKTTKVGDLEDKSQTEQAPSIRYVERMNGHMYKMFLDTKIKEKISNSTIPSIYEAFFDGNANTVIYRYLSSDKVVSSFMATLGTPKGEFLPQNISDLSISPDQNKFFYLTENTNGVTGVVGTFGDVKRDVVFTSPFTEWLSGWANNQKIFLTTKPSFSVLGSVFLLNTTNKTVTKIFGDIAGLTTLVNKDASYILYSTSTETGPKLEIFDIVSHSTKDLNTYGLPEKCVWSIDNINVYCAVPSVITGNQYPDIWYQGLISFDDYFVKINTRTGDKTTIANSTTETPVDGTHLFLDKTEGLLFFINKKDSTLWSLDIK